MTSNGIEIEHEVIGDGDPLVLIMGLGAQLVHWSERFCEQLAERGYRVVRFDNRDCGLSTRLDGARVPNVRRALVRHAEEVEPPPVMETLRASGIQSGGPASLNEADKREFANQLDRYLNRYTKARTSS